MRNTVLTHAYQRVCLRLFFMSAALASVLWVGWFQWLVVADRSVSAKATLVVANRVSQTMKSGGGSLNVQYRYEHSGKEYIGDQVAFGGVWFGNAASSDSELVSTVDHLRQSQAESIKIWVDPSNPQESALLQRVHPGLRGVTLFIALALLMGVIRAFIDIACLRRASAQNDRGIAHE